MTRSASSNHRLPVLNRSTSDVFLLSPVLRCSSPVLHDVWNGSEEERKHGAVGQLKSLSAVADDDCVEVLGDTGDWFSRLRTTRPYTTTTTTTMITIIINTITIMFMHSHPLL